VQYENLPKVVHVGDRVMIDDGLIEMKVSAIKGGVVTCDVLNGGKLGSTKAISHFSLFLCGNFLVGR
jgi:pyruvate kinase